MGGSTLGASHRAFMISNPRSMGIPYEIDKYIEFNNFHINFVIYYSHLNMYMCILKNKFIFQVDVHPNMTTFNQQEGESMAEPFNVHHSIG